MPNQKLQYTDYTIKDGLLKIYYPFYFQNYDMKNAAAMVECVQASSACISAEKYENDMVAMYLKKSFEDKIMKSSGEKSGNFLNTQDFLKQQQNCIAIEAEKLNLGKVMYGLQGVTGKQLLFLIPAFCRAYDGQLVHISITCNLFLNGCGILVADVPLQDVSVVPFFDLKYENVYKSLFSLEEAGDAYKCVERGQISMDYIVAEHIEKIAQASGYKILMGERFHMLLIGDLGKQEHLEQNVSYDFKEMVYRFLCAPVSTQKIPHKELDTFWEDSRFPLLDVQYHFSELGRGLAYLTLQDEAMEAEGKILTLDAGMMLPIEVCLLTKLNYDVTLERLGKFDIARMDWIKTQFISNQSFISKLGIQCSATAHKMIDFMRERLKYYLNTELFQTEYENMNEILLLRREGAKEKLAMAVSYLGFLIAGVFSLPMIQDTVHILREAFGSRDIPYITVEGVSTGIWIVLLVITFHVFRKYRKDSRFKVKRTHFLLSGPKDKRK